MPSEPRVRSINRISYVGRAFDGGTLWRGGILGGEVWVRNGSKRYALEMAATTAQEWARRNYHDAHQYIEMYQQACAAQGVKLKK